MDLSTYRRDSSERATVTYAAPLLSSQHHRHTHNFKITRSYVVYYIVDVTASKRLVCCICWLVLVVLWNSTSSSNLAYSFFVLLFEFVKYIYFVSPIHILVWLYISYYSTIRK